MKTFNTFIFTVTSLLLLTSCDPVSDTPLTVTPVSLTMYVGDTQHLYTNKSADVTFTVLDPWYASVSPVGSVTANKVGKTTIVVQDKGHSCKVGVTVNSKYDLYPEMEAYMGKPLTAVSEFFPQSYDEFLDHGTLRTYWYYNRSKYNLAFGFVTDKSDSNKTIQSVSVYFPVAYEKQMESYIWDRYYCFQTLNDVYFFYDHDQSVLLSLEYFPSQRMYNFQYLPIE